MLSGRTLAVVLCAGTVLGVGGALVSAPAAHASVVAEADAVVPDPPTQLQLTPGNRTLDVQWAPPAVDGGSAVTAYDVVASPIAPDGPNPPTVTIGVVGTSAALAPLANGVPYDVEVRAVNDVGAGAPASAQGVPRTVPDPPTVTAVTGGDASATVSWAAPVHDGGADVSAYLLTALPSGVVVSAPGDRARATLTGLPNGAATTVTVAAVNAAGMSSPAASTDVVTPRRPGHLVVRSGPATQVVYGAATAVTASLVAGGQALPGERVELLGRLRPSGVWRPVAHGSTGANGRVTLHARLPANAALALHHPRGASMAPDRRIGSVTVADRVVARTGSGRSRVGAAIVTRGRVAPAQRVGSVVRLQRRVAGGWRTVGSGRMTTGAAYRIRWQPRHPERYTLRVLRPGDRAHAAGVSASWHQRVLAESAADIARAILHSRRISLARVHTSGIRDDATAQQNIVDIAAGRLAHRSAYQNAPGGYTSIDLDLLRALRAMAAEGSVEVSEIAGGSHAPGSSHYSGHALDIDIVDGRSVGWGTGYGLVVRTCLAYGASTIFDPGYDPYGGHANHVHCEWQE